VQIAVDCKHKLIVEHEVTNHGGDLGLLAPTVAPAVELLEVEDIDVVADKGYYKIEDIEACEEAGLVPYVAKPQRGYAVRKGFFTKDDFLYDAEADQYVCPADQRLSPLSASKSRDNKKLLYYNRAACKSCDIRAKCTDNKMGARHVSRLENEAIMDRMAERLKARPEIMDQRRESVEHPFGSIKQWMNQGAFLMRGLEKVKAEFSLTAIAYNLCRVFNLVSFVDLMAAVKG